MTYKVARDMLQATVRTGMVPGLTSISGLLEQLKRPDQQLQIIHVAGTNGKGSVNAYLYEILGQAGYRVGRYSSPVVFHEREQIQVAGVPISEAEYVTEVQALLAAMAQMQQEGQELPTMFEAETAMAFAYFNKKNCDLVLLETGMGGRYDATNAIGAPELCVFTPIGMDHTAMLGDTLEAIAWHKAGIIKAGTIAVTAVQEEAVMRILQKQCQELQVPLIVTRPEELAIQDISTTRQVFSYREYRQLEVRMAGQFQVENAILALEAVYQLQQKGFNITPEQIRQGLARTEWPGRLQQIGRRPDIYIDGAHNVMAARALAAFLKTVTREHSLILILGIFKDKEYEEIVRILVPYAKHVITTAAPGSDRALPAGALKTIVSRYHESCQAAAAPAEALKAAIRRADPADVIVAAGSLSYLGAIAAAKYEDE